jgi:hypothetical protein
MIPCWKKNQHLVFLALAAFTLMNPWFHSSDLSSIEANVFLRQLLYLDAATIIIRRDGKRSSSRSSSLNRSKIDEDIATKITHKSNIGSSRSRKLERSIKRSRASSKRRNEEKEVYHSAGYYQVLWDSTTTVLARKAPLLASEAPTLPARIIKLSKSATVRRTAWSTMQGSS